MAIQSQLNYTATNVNQIGFPIIRDGGGGGGNGSEFSFINNNGGIGVDQSYLNKDFNQQALFHQQYRSQSFLDVLMEKQKQEINQIIKLQNERLRCMLQEQRNQEMGLILRKMEDKAFVLMTQKEEEITKAMNKNIQLEDLLRKLEMENQNLQRKALENEAMVTKLKQIRERVCQHDVAVENEESFCNGESLIPEKKKKKMSVVDRCLNCGSNGVTRVLFLPCRHLCCCVDCEFRVVVCPICNTLKKSRIEALFC